MPFRVRARLAAVRDRLDAPRHPKRRAAAFDRLERLAPESMLFVCLGNVCRSPYAEWSVRERFGDRGVVADSAGFIGPGRNPPDRAQTVALERGIDHHENVSQVVTPELVSGFDAIFLFQQDHDRRLRKNAGGEAGRIFQLGDFDPEWVGTRAIVDPWGKPMEEFRITFARIDRCLDEVMSRLA